MTSSSEALAAITAPGLVGLTHAEVLDLTFEGMRFLVDDLIEPGVVVSIAGVPETFKSWVAARTAVGIAAGEGELFGRQVVEQGTVGYVWQDDSKRNEASRIQLLHETLELSRDLPVRWLLNEGMHLPDDIERLRAWVQEYELRLLTLDSLYNFLTVDPKDTDVGVIYRTLKAEIADATGCTVLVVDHMPWGNETNRKRLRGYGNVFKGAAARAGIYITPKGQSYGSRRAATTSAASSDRPRTGMPTRSSSSCSKSRGSTTTSCSSASGSTSPSTRARARARSRTASRDNATASV